MYTWLLKSFYFLNRKNTEFLLNRAIRKSVPKTRHGSNFLYLAASCLPYHISGYTARTHALLTSLAEVNAPVIALTRTGYPWDRKDRISDTNLDCHLEGNVLYHHLRTPTRLKQVAHYSLAAAAQIEKFALSHNVGRIHAASNHVNALPGLIAARRLGIPFQYEMRGLWELSRASRQPGFNNSPAFKMGIALEKLVAQNADRLFVISEQLGNYISKNWDISQDRINLLPNCVTNALFSKNPGKTVTPGLLGYAGSLIEYEGMDVLLEALAHLRNRGKRILLRIIGDGEARERLQELASLLKLDEQVEFLGRKDQATAHELLGECEAICIPRKPYEVCKIITPLKLVEAMALGKPVFAADLPVFREELGELAEGWTFTPGDAQDLARLLEKQLTDKTALLKQGEELRKKARQSRMWEHFTDKILGKVN